MESFRIREIKAFADSGDIELKPITILVGKNSCGKSSLLRFPAVLAQSFLANTDSPIQFYGNLVDFGSFSEVLHRGSKGELSFEYTVSVPPTAREVRRNMRILYYKLQNSQWHKDSGMMITLQVTIGRKDNNLIVERVSVRLGNRDVLTIVRIEEAAYKLVVQQISLQNEHEEVNYEITMRNTILENDALVYEDEEMVQSIAEQILGEKISEEAIRRVMFAYQISNRVMMKKELNNLSEKMSEVEKEVLKIFTSCNTAINFFTAASKQWKREASNLHYIGPFRKNPERVYRDSEMISRDVGAKGENISTLLIRDINNENRLIQTISEWTKTTMGCAVRINDVGYGLFQIVLEDGNGFQTNLMDNGYGVSQVLPIVAQVAEGIINDSEHSPSELTIIEQPELHLHPAAQAELADLFTEYVCNKKGEKKLLIETHSEHLIRKLQVLIADKDCNITSEMVKIYYVDKDQEGSAFVEEMMIQENGKFVNRWPSGFFDKSKELTIDLLKAIDRQ